MTLLFAVTITGGGFAFESTIIGVKAGASFSSYWGDGLDDFEEILGQEAETSVFTAFTGGAFATFVFIEDFFAIQPELIYARLGRNFEWEDLGIEQETYTDYIEVPVLVKLMIPMDIIMPHAYLGPSFAFRVDGVSDLDVETAVQVSREFDEDDFHSFDFGLRAGLGADIFLGPGAIVIDARYGMGFIDVFDVDDADNIKTWFFSIMGGYGLEF